MNMSKDRANEIILTDPRYSSTEFIKRVISELETKKFPFKDETKDTLLFDWKFELERRKRLGK